MKTMRLRMTFAAMILMFVPLVAQAQFKDLDVAMSNLTRGFGSGDAQAIVAGIGEATRCMLQFPGLVDQNGFFGRDQAAYLLDGLFNRVKPTGFELQARDKKSAEGQYHISARRGPCRSPASPRRATSTSRCATIKTLVGRFRSVREQMTRLQWLAPIAVALATAIRVFTPRGVPSVRRLLAPPPRLTDRNRFRAARHAAHHLDPDAARRRRRLRDDLARP